MGFNNYQLIEVANGKKSNVDISKYYKESFPSFVMSEIRKGLENGVDITRFLENRKLSFFQIRQVRLALERGISTTIMLSENFNCCQMKEIRQGLERGLDVSKYAKESLDYKDMLVKRHQLELKQIKEQNKDEYFYVGSFNSKNNIFTINNSKDIVSTGKDFKTEQEAHKVLAEMLRLSYFSNKNIHILGSIGALNEISENLKIKDKILANYPNLKTNTGYYILAENQNIAFGFSPTAPDKFVVWERDVEGDYIWGKYSSKLSQEKLEYLSTENIDTEKIIEMLNTVGKSDYMKQETKNFEEWER